MLVTWFPVLEESERYAGHRLDEANAEGPG